MPVLKAITYNFGASGNIPNNPTLPLLFYRKVFPANTHLEQMFKAAFKKNNWCGTWVNGIFRYHHYHSTAHEVLGILAGSATLVIGGPDGKEIEVEPGDTIILPAGTGHCRKHASPDFKVIGAYPAGQEDYDICTEEDIMEEKNKNIAQVPLPTADPIGGNEGPLLVHWR